MKAICVGLSTGLIGMTSASYIAASATGLLLARIANNPTSSFLSVELSLNLIFLFLSGYATGMIAKDGPVFNSIIVGGVLLILNILSYDPSFKNQTWYTLASLLAIFPVTYIGGCIASKSRISPSQK